MIDLINKNYPIHFDSIEFFRDGGSTSYTLFAGLKKYFLRVIKPTFFDTVIKAVDVQLFLQSRNFLVPSVVLTQDGLPYIKTDDGLFILYDFIEGDGAEPENDAETAGALAGQLHNIMKEYQGGLIHLDKHFYIGRYIDILRAKQYAKVDEFVRYSDELWEKVKDLDYGYCHGDMHSGNMQKTSDGKIYLLDFDTSCYGFPMYDITLFCNQTNYFEYDEQGYEKSRIMLNRFLPEYGKYNTVSQNEIDAYYDLIAMYHFTLQATMIELYGLDCVDSKWLNNQLDWLYRWREQCGKMRGKTI
jgi:Ser/Thr protein kinase RdoA (MazF antagonist)